MQVPPQLLWIPRSCGGLRHPMIVQLLPQVPVFPMNVPTMPRCQLRSPCQIRKTSATNLPCLYLYSSPHPTTAVWSLRHQVTLYRRHMSPQWPYLTQLQLSTHMPSLPQCCSKLQDTFLLEGAYLQSHPSRYPVCLKSLELACLGSMSLIQQVGLRLQEQHHLSKVIPIFSMGDTVAGECFQIWTLLVTVLLLHCCLVATLRPGGCFQTWIPLVRVLLLCRCLVAALRPRQVAKMEYLLRGQGSTLGVNLLYSRMVSLSPIYQGQWMVGMPLRTALQGAM